MMIKYINLDRLRQAPGSTSILRLVMALNDVASSEAFMTRILPDLPLTDSLKRVKADAPEYDRLHLPALQGYLRYIIRMRIGHLAEAGRIVGDIEAGPELQNTLAYFVQRHEDLWTGVKSAFNDARFRTQILAVRNSLGFHYNHSKEGKLLRNALDRWIDEAGHSTSSVVMSLNQDFMRLELGDDLFDSAYSDLLNVPVGTEFHEQLFENMGYSHDLVTAFGDFAWPFIDFFCTRHGIYQ